MGIFDKKRKHIDQSPGNDVDLRVQLGEDGAEMIIGTDGGVRRYLDSTSLPPSMIVNSTTSINGSWRIFGGYDGNSSVPDWSLGGTRRKDFIKCKWCHRDNAWENTVCDGCGAPITH